MNKENWIGEILEAAKQLPTVPSNPYLASRIEARLQNEKKTRGKLSLQWVYVSVTAMLIVIVVNIVIWKSNERPARMAGIDQLVHEYGFSGDDLYSFDYSK
jgi:hypothetical protein